MKSFAFTLGALATIVAAQDISGLPECGVFCANDMLTGKAPELGCSENDTTCVCQNRNFIYGLRDCSAATCGSEDARRIVDFGIALCRDAGVAITTGPGGEPTPTGSEIGEDGSTIDGGSVSTIYTTVSSDESTITTPIATTTLSDESSGTPGASGTGGVGGLVSTVTDEDTTFVTTLTTSGAAGLVSTVTEEDTTFVTTLTTDESDGSVSTVTEEDTTFVTTLSTSDSEDDVTTITSEGTTVTSTLSTSASDETETETDGGNDSETSTDEDGAAMPQRTMAPVGVLAAGLAVLLL